jgi:integrase
MAKLTKPFVENPIEYQEETQNLASMEDLSKNYLECYSCHKTPKGLQEDQKLLENIILPTLGHIKVEHVMKRDIEALHKKLETTPYQANRVLALLSKMFSLAVTWLWRGDNPAIGIERYPEQRDRYLDEKELHQLWGVLDSHLDHLTACALKFLALTGARKSEVLQATWDQLDLEKGIWTKPSSLTKQQKQEHIPLSEKAIEVLQSVKKLNPEGSLHVFTDHVEGNPLKEIKAFWKIVLEEAELKDVRIGDLRHVHTSHLAAA